MEEQGAEFAKAEHRYAGEPDGREKGEPIQGFRNTKSRFHGDSDLGCRRSDFVMIACKNAKSVSPRQECTVQASTIKLAIISTHPIQYYAPIFRELARSEVVSPHVFYTWSQSESGTIYDRGFGQAVKWDIPLLEGYSYEFVPNVARHPGPGRFWGIRNPQLVRRIRDWGPDAILVYGWALWSHLRALGHFKGKVPVLFRGDSTLLDEQPPARALARRAVLRWVYRHVDLAIAVGQNNRDYFSRHGLSAAQIAFAPHSVDVARFADPDGAHENAAQARRRDLGIADEEPVIVYAGKFLPKKDPELLLSAFGGVRRPAHLVFYGGGVLEGRLRVRAAGNARVHFRPFQNQLAMPTVYRVADLFVLPSRGPGETWGLALNEAMASGRAVIASSKVGGARDLIDPGINGWTFEAADIASLTAVLEAALALGRDGLRRMGDVAKRMSASWSTEVAAEKISNAVIQQVRGPQRDAAVGADISGVGGCANRAPTPRLSRSR